MMLHDMSIFPGSSEPRGQTICHALKDGSHSSHCPCNPSLTFPSHTFVLRPIIFATLCGTSRSKNLICEIVIVTVSKFQIKDRAQVLYHKLILLLIQVLRLMKRDLLAQKYFHALSTGCCIATVSSHRHEMMLPTNTNSSTRSSTTSSISTIQKSPKWSSKHIWRLQVSNLQTS